LGVPPQANVTKVVGELKMLGAINSPAPDKLLGKKGKPKNEQTKTGA